MKENKTKPDIRFKGFTEAWEQRKLGEVVEFYNGDRSSRYPTDSDIVPDGIPFINAGDLVSGRVKLDTANKITKEKYNELSGAKIQRGDIIYCLRGTLGKNAFIDNFDSGTVASSLVDIRPKKIVGKYLFQVLNSDIEYRQRTINDEGAAQPNLSAKNLSLFDIPMSNKDEQTKIAEYFSNLDNLITLHQRECDQLKELKKSMLKKMFPRDESSIPEVRFAGFTDAWEQRKLKDLIVDLKSGLSRMLKNEDIGVPVVRANNIEDNKLDMNNDVKYWYNPDPQGAKIENYTIKKDDILINFINSEAKMGTATIVKKTPIRPIIYTTNILRMRTNTLLKPYFYLTHTNLQQYKNYIKQIMKPAVNQASFTTVDYKNYNLKIPKEDEQHKIELIFKNIDNLITLHQRL